MKKKRQTILLILMFTATIVLGACSTKTVRGPGKGVKESREASGISSVILANTGDLTIDAGDAESLRIHVCHKRVNATLKSRTIKLD